MDRLTDELVEQAKSLYCGAVYDTLRFDFNLKSPFVLSEKIKPLVQDNNVLVGLAFTCQAEPVQDKLHIDDSVRIKMFRDFYKGCVQVISSGGYRKVAQFGDISAKIASKCGAVGAVVDAPTRDAKLIKEFDWPVFCTGVQPIDAYERWQITQYQTPIKMPGIEGDVTVNPGDMIWGDTDGVIVIPNDIMFEVISKALDRAKKEDYIREQIINYDNILEMYNDLGRW